MLLSIVVPCFNEEENIDVFFKELDNVLQDEAFRSVESELIFVDDGSSDNTLEKVKTLGQCDPRIRFISFSRNFGKEAAIYAGLEMSSGDYVAIMDADLQDPPSMLPGLFRAVCKGGEHDEAMSDIARARRITRKGEPPIRSIFARLFYRLINTSSNIEIVDGARDYQVMNRDVVNAILSVKEYNRFFKGISSWVGFRTHWFEYENTERLAGASSWSFLGLVRYAIEGITAFSTAPLLIASASGVLFCILAFIFMILIIVRTLVFGDPVSGWPSTICVILFVGGIQLFCIGILGQYLSRTYLETKRRPLYLVKETNIE